MARLRYPVVAAFSVLPALLAGPLCAVLDAPQWLALALGFIASAAVIFWLSAHLPPPTLRWQKTALTAAVALAACAALYSRPFAGLPAWIGSDSGNHAGMLWAANPHAYEGFASMYLWWHLLEQLLRLDAFHSFTVLFYGELILLAAVPLAITFAVLRPVENRRAWSAGAWTAAVALAASLGLVVLPLVHYFQVEGFWTQIFVLVPLLLLWWLDVTLESHWARLAAWAVAVVVVRYTYGLNLVELLVAFACVLLLDAPKPYRWPAAALAAVSLYAAWVAPARFAKVVPMWGWFVGYDVARALAAGQRGLAALVVVAVAAPELSRPLRLPVLVAVGGFFVTVYHQHFFRPIYYVYKYPFGAICLVAVAGGVALGFAAARIVERRRLRDVGFGAVALALHVAALATWFSTFAEYHAGYVERLLGRPPHVLRPLVDLGAMSRIDKTLALEKKQFGGYLVGFGPMSNFMNSSRGIGTGQKFYFEGRPPKMDAGYCVFWDGTQPEPWPEFNRWYRHRSLVQRLTRDAKAKCEDYDAPWNDTVKRRICHLCR